MPEKPTTEFYARNGQQVPKDKAYFYAIETTRFYSMHDGKQYLSRTKRIGWLATKPDDRVSLKNIKERDIWIAKVTCCSN